MKILTVILFLFSVALYSQDYEIESYSETKSGLKYIVISSGKGEQTPNDGDRVNVFWDAKIAGKDSVFESYRKYGSFSFIVGKRQVIPGIDEAIRLMSVDDKFQFVIPANLAYGSLNVPNIPSNSTLVYEIELIEIIPEERTIKLFNVSFSDTLKAESGIRYQIEKKGEGHYPKIGDRIEFHFNGYTIHGNIFESTYREGKSKIITIGENQIIKGIELGLQIMNQGARYRLHIPAEKGFGKRFQNESVPKNTDLVVDIELVKIYKSNAKPGK